MVSRHAQRRRAHNSEIIKRMRQGEHLETFSMEDSAFPQRPVVKKEKDALCLLIGKNGPKKVSNN